MQQQSNIFTYHHIVTKDEIDTLNHVNNVVYVQWIQDISTKHWNDLTKNSPDLHFVWVVTRHEIDYKGQALLGDEITFKTCVGETKGVTSVRYVDILKNDVLVVKVQNIRWMLHAELIKPVSITKSDLKGIQL